MKKREFLFTIDVDYVRGSESGLEDLIRFSERLGLRPTVFITGMFAVEFPELIKEVATQGYGLGTHGWAHGKDPNENFQTASYEDQLKWVKLATDAVEEAAGKRPVSFRAPNLWVSETTLQVLEAVGYIYDSSVPSRRFDLGYGQVSNPKYFSAPLIPYHPSAGHMGKTGNSHIIEIAPSAYFVPINMSALRVLGFRAVTWAVRRVAKRSSTLVFYLHPGEFVESEKLQYVGKIPRRHLDGVGPQNFDLLEKFVEYVLNLGYTSATIEDIRL